MRKTIAVALTGIGVLASIAPAEARWHGHGHGHNRVIVTERTNTFVPLLGALLTAQVIANMAAPPTKFVEVEPTQPYTPRYGPDSKAPLR